MLVKYLFVYECIILLRATVDVQEEQNLLLFQISSHVKAIDAIYQGTQFKDIRNISFMVKRIRVSLSFREGFAFVPLRC